MVIATLIGLKFTRSKYGIQKWVKTIDKVYYTREKVSGAHYKLVTHIIANDGDQYLFDDIVIVWE